MFFRSRIDSETQWIESFDSNPEVRQSLDPGSEDPASFTDLTGKGRDDFAFGLTKETGEQTRVRGFDKLTGKSFVIDGVTLKQTEFEFTETDTSGNILRQSRGHEFISPEWRMFFSGPSEWNDGTGYVPMDGSPVQFILPGEPKFGSTQPIFDCDTVVSQNGSAWAKPFARGDEEMTDGVIIGHCLCGAVAVQVTGAHDPQPGRLPLPDVPAVVGRRVPGV